MIIISQKMIIIIFTAVETSNLTLFYLFVLKHSINIPAPSSSINVAMQPPPHVQIYFIKCILIFFVINIAYNEYQSNLVY
jgi:hypothetical protein